MTAKAEMIKEYAKNYFKRRERYKKPSFIQYIKNAGLIIKDMTKIIKGGGICRPY